MGVMVGGGAIQKCQQQQQAQDAAFAEIACHRAGRHLPPSLPSNQLGLILDLPGFNSAMA